MARERRWGMEIPPKSGWCNAQFLQARQGQTMNNRAIWKQDNQTRMLSLPAREVGPGRRRRGRLSLT